MERIRSCGNRRQYAFGSEGERTRDQQEKMIMRKPAKDKILKKQYERYPKEGR